MAQSTSDSDDAGQSPRTPTRRGALRGTAGVAATLVALPTLSGLASAHFPHELSVDVQPQNADNYLDLENADDDETVTVAISPSTFLRDGEETTFDPREEAVRYRFGPKHTVADGEGARPVDDGEVKEVEGHHGTHEALFLEFPLDDAGFDGGEETAWLYWERDESGEHGYSGVDSVRVVGGEGSEDDLSRLLRRIVRALRGGD